MKVYTTLQKNNGFTLFELMVVVAIVATLTTLAASSYTSAMAKSDRSIAIADINDIALSQSRYFSANRVYTDDFKEINMASAANTSTITDNQSYYDYTISIQNTGANYLLEATPKAKSRDNWDLRITDTGVKTRKPHSGATWVSNWP